MTNINPVLEEQYLSLTIPAPEPSIADWNDDGFVIKKGLIPERLLEEYEACWIENNAEYVDGQLIMTRPGGWPDCTPYRRHPEIINILTYSEINDTMEELIGEPAAVHLNLTGWVTTRRNWHQDTYLNPPHVGDYYVAIWIAFETIHPDSGPFQMIPGSHRWPTVTREKILAALPPQKRDFRWPSYSEEILTPIFKYQIQKRNAAVFTYLPNRGDVLFWHGRLLHRGSIPNTAGMIRKSLIAHYSGINHRQDMPMAMRHGSGWYFPISGGNTGQ
jgi:ectoine hydroxylase-related dioxygenase (phytanoyl-CoA dioxygenase family)